MSINPEAGEGNEQRRSNRPNLGKNPPHLSDYELSESDPTKPSKLGEPEMKGVAGSEREAGIQPCPLEASPSFTETTEPPKLSEPERKGVTESAADAEIPTCPPKETSPPFTGTPIVESNLNVNANPYVSSISSPPSGNQTSLTSSGQALVKPIQGKTGAIRKTYGSQDKPPDPPRSERSKASRTSVKAVSDALRKGLQERVELRQQMLELLEKGVADSLEVAAQIQDLGSYCSSLPDRTGDTESWLENNAKEAMEALEIGKSGEKLIKHHISSKGNEDSQLYPQMTLAVPQMGTAPEQSIPTAVSQPEVTGNRQMGLQGVQATQNQAIAANQEPTARTTQGLGNTNALISSKIHFRPNTVPLLNQMSNNEPPRSSTENQSAIEPVSQITSSFHPRRLRDAIPNLPEFDGQPRNWLFFKSACLEAKETHTMSSLRTGMRNSLTGAAARFVKTSFILGQDVEALISQLERSFGRPDFIIREALEDIRAMQLPEPTGKNSGDYLGTLVEYATSVRNLIGAMANLPGNEFNSYELLSELPSKLPMNMKLEWGQLVNSSTGVRLTDFCDWIENYAEAAQTISTQPLKSPKTAKGNVYYHENTETRESETRTGFRRDNPSQCRICNKGKHWHGRCPELLDMGIEERRERVSERELCFNCLATNHYVDKCRNKRRCSVGNCERKHHTLLCLGNSTRKNQSEEKKTEAEVEEKTKPMITGSVNLHELEENILFKIVPVTLHGPTGISLKTYALIDEASSLSLLGQDIAEKLKLNGVKQPLCLRWTSGVVRGEDNSRLVSLKISCSKNKQQYRLKNLRTVERLALQPQTINLEQLTNRFPYLSSLDLPILTNAKPTLLIGLDYAQLGVPLKTIERGWEEPIAVKTRLGWTIYGPTGTLDTGCARTASLNLHQASCNHDTQRDEEFSRELKHFFSTESFGTKITGSPLEARMVQHARETFEKTTRRIGNRWETGLFWKESCPELRDTKEMAVHRWHCLQRKMNRDPQLRKSMTDTMKNYVEKGYARKLSQSEANSRSQKTNYLPVLGVWNENKGKFRAVSDAAAKVDGQSLNDCLDKGPSLYTPIFVMLTKFRLGQIGLIGDIREMFHQVIIRKEDQDAQRFLWTENPDTNAPPDEYKMLVMTFGATCSPSIAQLIKNRNAEEFRDKFPAAVEAIVNKHYVDDLLYSDDSAANTIRIAKEIVEIHAKGGFEIRGYVSNSRKVMQSLGSNPDTISSIKTLKLDPESPDPNEMVLGMVWDIISDTFKFQLNFHKVSKDVMTGKRAPTRREIASAMGSLYDPLGFLAHFRIPLAMLSQELTQGTLNWDDTIDGVHLERWKLWLSELPAVGTVSVPRTFSPKPLKEALSVELHVFVDASDRAFAAVAYLRVEYPSNQNFISFIAGRARVGPIKTISVNRMELQAAVLGSRLALQLTKETELQFTKRYMWYDSQTVGAWINSSHRTYKTFVALRITEILEDTLPQEWHYVRSNQNPADLATKRVGTPNYDPEGFWFQGPPFLREPKSEWPTEGPPHLSNLDILEIKITSKIVNFHQQVTEILDITKISSWNRLARTFATVIRAAENFKSLKKGARSGNTSIKYIKSAEQILIKKAQQDEFPDEMKALESFNQIQKSSLIFSLSPFLGSDGLIKIKTRLEAAKDVAQTAKNPTLLPRRHHLTKLKVLQYHERFAHQSTSTVVNELRQSYWIPHIRTEVRTIIAACQRCKNRKAKPTYPEMSPLPAARLMSHTKAFLHTGVDFAGPFEIIMGRRHEKRWIALFTCLTTRAIHLELAHSLSSDSFILCLKNFIHRRGLCTDMYSDCGTNFVGATKELQEAMKDFNLQKAADEAITIGINWHFNPPASPHMGGAWERMVRSVKTVLKALIDKQPLKDELFRSFLIETEFIINSRPLTFISLEHEDDEALTPNSFLLGTTTGLMEQERLGEFSQHARKQWKCSQGLADHFWNCLLYTSR